MNSEHLFCWHRHVVFDPMNAHSQADDPALVYVMQFNADERTCQEKREQKLADGVLTHDEQQFSGN